MRWYPILALSLLTCLLVGCIRSVRDTSVVSVESGPVVVEIWASTNCAEWGKPVSLRASVRNDGAHTLVVELKDRPVFDLNLNILPTRADKPIIMRHWSDGKALTPDLTRLELKAGQVRTLEMEWVVDAPSGYYAASAKARFIYSPERVALPINPSVMIYIAPNCPGGI